MKKKIFSLVLALALVLPLMPALDSDAVGYGSTIDTPIIPLPIHDYDNACDPDCNTCGEFREVTHNYSVQDKNTETHWMKCSVCGVIDESTRESHGYDNACDTTCDECGQTRAATHDYSVQDKDATNHWMKCSVCGTIDHATHESHGYDNACDTTCDECGFTRKITHNYSVQDKNTETHWMKCSVCGTVEEESREAHGYDNNCDTTCNECGYVRTITHDYSVQDKNSETHWMKCSVCGVIDESTRESHGYDNACDTTCDECGFTRKITHNYSVQDKNAETHWMKCSVCGATDETTRTPHVYDNTCDPYCNTCGESREITHDFSALQNSEHLHWYNCSVCGTTDDTSYTEHLYDNDCDPSCNVCQRERTVTHNYSAWDTDPLSHSKKCSVCGTADEATRTPHVYDNACDTDCNECAYLRATTHDFSVQTGDENAHWMKCSVCDGADDSTRAPHVYDNACDTDCNTCGIPRLTTHDFSVQDWNDELHWIKCSVCGTADDSTLAVHHYTDGKDTTCGACGYERTTTYIPGDVDNDGDVDLDDAIYLLYHVNFPTTYPVSQPVDFNGDGGEDLDDAIYLLYHVNFKDTYPLH